MAFYFEDVEGEEDYFADADEGAGGGVHDCFAGAGAEGGVELVAVVEGEVVAGKGLAAVFVDSLEDLGVGGLAIFVERECWEWVVYFVASCVAETWEEGGEFSEGGGVGFVFEDYFVEAGD